MRNIIEKHAETLGNLGDIEREMRQYPRGSKEYIMLELQHACVSHEIAVLGWAAGLGGIYSVYPKPLFPRG